MKLNNEKHYDVFIIWMTVDMFSHYRADTKV